MTDETTTVNEASKQVIDSGTPAVADKGPPLVVPGYVSQEQVNGIAADARRKAYDKGRSEATESFKQEKTDLLRKADTSNNNTQDVGAIMDAKFAERDEKLKTRQEADQTRYQQAQNEQLWNQMSTELGPKIEAAQKNHTDFSDTINKADYLNTAPELLFLANRIDNSAEVLYQLAADPAKLANFKTVARETPHLVEGMMKKYAAALDKQSSGSTSLPPDPLSQLSPSNVGGDDGKLETVDDFRAKYTV